MSNGDKAVVGRDSLPLMRARKGMEVQLLQSGMLEGRFFFVVVGLSLDYEY